MVTFWIVLLMLVLLLCLFVAFSQVSALVSLIRTKGVPYVPLKKRQLKNLENNIFFTDPEKIKLVDLGSGDGRVLRLFNDLGIKDLTGYELNWWAHLKAKVINRWQKRKIKLYNNNFLTIDLSKYNVVFCYLMPDMLMRLRQKFDQELESGTMIYSYAFPIADWREAKVIEFPRDELGMTQIHVYTID